jgi:hypothetical protein
VVDPPHLLALRVRVDRNKTRESRHEQHPVDELEQVDGVFGVLIYVQFHEGTDGEVDEVDLQYSGVGSGMIPGQDDRLGSPVFGSVSHLEYPGLNMVIITYCSPRRTCL